MTFEITLSESEIKELVKRELAAKGFNIKSVTFHVSGGYDPREPQVITVKAHTDQSQPIITGR